MDPVVAVFLVVMGLMILWAVRQMRMAGPAQLSAAELRLGSPLVRVTAEDPGQGWEELGSRTRVDGLDLLFEADDDPRAEASLLVPAGLRTSSSTFERNRTIRLTGEFETHHVHAAGYVFRIRLRGTGDVVGKEVEIGMSVDNEGEPYGGRIENDDDDDPAVGDWIEVEWAEVLSVPDQDE